MEMPRTLLKEKRKKFTIDIFKEFEGRD